MVVRKANAAVEETARDTLLYH